MLRLIQAMVIGVLLLAVPAAAQEQQSIDAMSKADIAIAKAYIKQKNYPAAYGVLAPYLLYEGKPYRRAIRQLKRKKLRRALYDAVADTVAGESTKHGLFLHMGAIAVLRDTGFFDAQQRRALLQAADQRVTDLWRARALNLYVFDDYARFSVFRDPAERRRLFINSADLLVGDPPYSTPVLEGALAFLQDPQNTALALDLRAALRERVAGLWLSRMQITSYIAPLFPDMAADMLADRTVYYVLKSAPRNLFFEADFEAAITEMLPNFMRVEPGSMPRGHPQLLVIEASQISFQERDDGGYRSRMTVQRSDFDFLSTLGTQEGTVYTVDVEKGEVMLAYSAQIEPSFAGQSAQPILIRSRDRHDYHSCYNALLHSPEDGISAAQFFPNSAINDYCARGRGRPDMDTLRAHVYQNMARRLADIKGVQAIIDLDKSMDGKAGATVAR